MGLRDRLTAKAQEAADAARERAEQARDEARDRARQAKDAAEDRADRTREAARERVDRVRDAAVERGDRAREAVARHAAQGPLGSLLGMDDDGRLGIERLVLLLVGAVRDDEDGVPGDDDVLAAARRRYRRLGTLSLPSGPLGGVLVNLYCEAATLCDVVASRGRTLSDEAVAAHLLVLWGVVPDVQDAADALSGRGPGVRELVAARARDRARVELPDPMTKRAAVRALWRLRAVPEELAETEGAGIRERLFPGRRVAAFVAEAHERLDGPAPRFPAPVEGTMSEGGATEGAAADAATPEDAATGDADAPGP